VVVTAPQPRLRRAALPLKSRRSALAGDDSQSERPGDPRIRAPARAAMNDLSRINGHSKFASSLTEKRCMYFEAVDIEQRRAARLIRYFALHYPKTAET